MSTRRPSRSTPQSVWAAEEIAKRTNGRYTDRRLPGLAARQGNRHQPGPVARHGRHHHLGLELRGARAIPPIGVTYYPYIFRDADHLLAYTKSDVFKELTQGLRGQDRPPHRGGHLLRRAPHHLEQADQDLRRHEGPEDPRARRAGLSRDAARLRRQHRADRLRRGLSRAAERHRRGAGEPADHDRGEEVLRGPEAHRADRPHRRPPQHGGRRARSGRSCPTRTRRSSPTSCRRPPARATEEIKAKREAKLVGFFKEKGLTVTEVDKDDFEQTRAEERDLRELRLPQGRLGRDPGDQVGSLSRPPGGPSRPARRRGAASDLDQRGEARHDAAGSSHRRSPPRNSPTPSRTRRRRGRSSAIRASRTGSRWRSSGCMALCVFLQFFTRYVLNNSLAWTEEIAINCLVVVVFLGSVDVRAPVAAHPGRPALPLPAARASARVLSTARRRRPHRASSPTRPSSSGATSSIVGDERDDRRSTCPKRSSSTPCFAGFVLMFAALDPGRWSRTGGAAIRCWSGPKRFDGIGRS